MAAADQQAARCAVCRANDEVSRPARYVCGSCFTRYCSSACYAAHNGGRCREEAQQRDEEIRVRNMLRLSEVRRTDEEKRKMRREAEKMLQRVAEQAAGDGWPGEGADGGGAVDDLLGEDGDEEGDVDLAALDLEHLELDDLGPRHRERFLRAVASGVLAVEPWEAWWDGPGVLPLGAADPGRPDRRIEELGDSEPPGQDPPPLPPQDLPRVADLLKGRQPSPLLPALCADVLLSYAVACRLFDGDLLLDPPAAWSVVVGISGVLARDARPEGAGVAVAAVLEAAARPGSAAADFAGLAPWCLIDVIRLLQTPSWACRALWHLRALCLEARGPTPLAFKLYFFSAWARGVPPGGLDAAAQEVREHWELVRGTMRPEESGEPRIELSHPDEKRAK